MALCDKALRRSEGHTRGSETSNGLWDGPRTALPESMAMLMGYRSYAPPPPRKVRRSRGSVATTYQGKGKGKGSREGKIGQGGRGRAQGGERPMGTTAYGGRGSKGRAAGGDRPVGAASCRPKHTKVSYQPPPPPRQDRSVLSSMAAPLTTPFVVKDIRWCAWEPVVVGRMSHADESAVLKLQPTLM